MVLCVRSVNEHLDPWTAPFVVLKDRVDYRDFPNPEMRGPIAAKMKEIKQGLVKFSKYEPERFVVCASVFMCVAMLVGVCSTCVSVR